MASIIKAFGGAFSPPEPEQPGIQLAKAMSEAGMVPPEDIQLDGKIHRFSTDAKGGNTGWYIAFADGIPAGRFGCWRAGTESTWRADIGRKPTAAEEMAVVRRMAEAKAMRDAKRENTAQTVETIWSEAGAATPEHPYLVQKGVKPHGARITGDGRLILPLFKDGSLSSLQYVSHDGQKKYHPGSSTMGAFFVIGNTKTDGQVYIAEGFATAATIHEITGRPCYVAYSAANLVPVTEYVKNKHTEILIVADNDHSGTGEKYAKHAGVRYVMPPIIDMDANDYVKAGYNLNDLLNPPKDEYLVSATNFAAEPKPTKWLVKNWIQGESLHMIHGPSGGGKTFVLLNMLMTVASGGGEWHGNRVSSGPVVYLAGEGHNGLRSRVAAWMQYHNKNDLKMWLSRHGCNLNTADGYNLVLESIRGLPVPPIIIAVDTLHRFYAGNENSAEDVKTMLDACSSLQREFSAAVILVHHTGVSQDAQDRGRGSSAWRGALEIELSIVRKKTGVITITPKKVKDAEEPEPVFEDLEKVIIKGWFDEDGDPFSSAVIINTEPPKVDNKILKASKIIERAWFSAGCDVVDGLPHISKDGLTELLRKDGKDDVTIRNYLKPSYPNGPISHLLAGGIIEGTGGGNGWLVICPTLSSSLLVSIKN